MKTQETDIDNESVEKMIRMIEKLDINLIEFCEENNVKFDLILYSLVTNLLFLFMEYSTPKEMKRMFNQCIEKAVREGFDTGTDYTSFSKTRLHN